MLPLPSPPMTWHRDLGNVSKSNKEFQEIHKKSENSEPTLKISDVFEDSSNESFLPSSELSNRFKLESRTTCSVFINKSDIIENTWNCIDSDIESVYSCDDTPNFPRKTFASSSESDANKSFPSLLVRKMLAILQR